MKAEGGGEKYWNIFDRHDPRCPRDVLISCERRNVQKSVGTQAIQIMGKRWRLFGDLSFQRVDSESKSKVMVVAGEGLYVVGCVVVNGFCMCGEGDRAKHGGQQSGDVETLWFCIEHGSPF